MNRAWAHSATASAPAGLHFNVRDNPRGRPDRARQGALPSLMVMQQAGCVRESRPRCGFADPAGLSEPTSIEPRSKVDGQQPGALKTVPPCAVARVEQSFRVPARLASSPAPSPWPRRVRDSEPAAPWLRLGAETVRCPASLSPLPAPHRGACAWGTQQATEHSRLPDTRALVA